MCSHEDQRNFLHVSELGHLDVVVVNGVEAGLVLQAEHEDHGVNPTRELEEKIMEIFVIKQLT